MMGMDRDGAAEALAGLKRERDGETERGGVKVARAAAVRHPGGASHSPTDTEGSSTRLSRDSHEEMAMGGAPGGSMSAPQGFSGLPPAMPPARRPVISTASPPAPAPVAPAADTEALRTFISLSGGMRATSEGVLKGKMQDWERRRVNDFIRAVQGGQEQVSRGDLARAMHEFVNPQRAREFFEKLVSRRRLNKLLERHMLPRVSRRERRAAAAAAAAAALSKASTTGGAGEAGVPPPAAAAAAAAAAPDGGVSPAALAQAIALIRAYPALAFPELAGMQGPPMPGFPGSVLPFPPPTTAAPLFPPATSAGLPFPGAPPTSRMGFAQHPVSMIPHQPMGTAPMPTHSQSLTSLALAALDASGSAPPGPAFPRF